MSNDQIDFESFIKDWDSSFDNTMAHKPAYHKPKKQEYVQRNNGYSIADLDKFLPDTTNDEDHVPSNVWEFLKSKGYDRGAIEYMTISFDNTKNVIDELEVTLMTGDKLTYNKIQLEWR
jgi:hypothetical protein